MGEANHRLWKDNRLALDYNPLPAGYISSMNIHFLRLPRHISSWCPEASTVWKWGVSKHSLGDFMGMVI